MASTTEPATISSASATTGAGDSSADVITARSDTMTLPRWIVYCQAAMLGVVATTFFVLGLMAGNLTSGSAANARRIETRVTGIVTFERDGVELPDSNAVVMILPADERPDERSKAATVNPLSFVPRNNPGIDRVHALGGAIVRADDEGRFRVIVEGPQRFHVLVVSQHAIRGEAEGLTKAQRAAVANFFIPVENAVGDQQVYWSSFEADFETHQLSDVVFK